MSKTYNKTFTNLKTVAHDTTILDAQKILIKTPADTHNGRTDIIDYINAVGEKIKKTDKTYNEYDTCTFAYGIEKSECDASSFRLGYKHTPNGIIKKVSTYARNNGGTYDCNTNGCYLLVQKYNKESGELVDSYLSTNKVIVQKNSESSPLFNTWEFDGFESCNEDEVLKFIPTSGNTQIADYYIGIVVDSTHTHIDCNVGGDTFVDGENTTPLGSGNKWLAYVKFEGEFTSDAENITLNDHITDETKHLNHLEKPFIKSLYKVSPAVVFNNNINNSALGTGQCKGFKLERPYIGNCVFNKISWTVTSGSVNNTIYMRLTLCDLRGHAIKSYWSSNSVDFSSTGIKEYSFDEWITIDDTIGSIICEASIDKINVVDASTSYSFRIATVGTGANNNTDGSELTNANIIVHLLFHGEKPTSICVTDDYNSRTTTTNATAEGECDGWNIAASNLPHDFTVTRIEIPVLNTVTTPHYLGAYLVTNGAKIAIGLSDNSITWTAGSIAIWNFKTNPITIPTGSQLELYIVTGQNGMGNNEGVASGSNIKVYYNASSSGSIRYATRWYNSRAVLCTLSSGIDTSLINNTANALEEHIGDDSHLTDSQKNIISDYNTSKSTFATKTEVESTYAKNATLFGGEHRTATGNDNSINWDACRIPAAYVPHLQPIHSIKLTALNTNSDVPMYLGAIAVNKGETQRELLKLSTNAVTWEANNEIIWDFGDGFIVPPDYQLELYLVVNEEDYSINPPSTEVLLQSSFNGSLGVGKYRPVSNTWGGPRLIDCALVTDAHISEDLHLKAGDRQLLDNLAAGYIENLVTNSVSILEDDEIPAAIALEPITVTVDDIVLTADTSAQNRMARAIVVMDDEETVQWLSSDKTIVTLSKSQLKQALKTAVGNEINNWLGI